MTFLARLVEARRMDILGLISAAELEISRRDAALARAAAPVLRRMHP